jgi:hypothetical protein
LSAIESLTLEGQLESLTLNKTVSSEWRTFSNDSGSKDRSRVGDVENRFLSNSGSDLSTMIAAPTNGAETAFSNLSHHRRHMNAADRALSAAYREIGFEFVIDQGTVCSQSILALWRIE